MKQHSLQRITILLALLAQALVAPSLTSRTSTLVAQQRFAQSVRLGGPVDSTEFCEVFEPCTPFEYSDSIVRLVTRSVRGRNLWDTEEYRLGATILVYLEFDDSLIVRRFDVGTFLSVDSSQRTDIESILLPVYRDYFADSVVGRRIRSSVLSACGGRLSNVRCDDGFARRDSTVSAGNVVYNQIGGTLMLRIRTGRPTAHGYYPSEVRLAMLSLRIRK